MDWTAKTKFGHDDVCSMPCNQARAGNLVLKLPARNIYVHDLSAGYHISRWFFQSVEDDLSAT